ncbi:MAG: formimidoylglutamate deiminase [SAR324 cluster bacterium]|jgi:formiminoglutamate deiminase|nr:formimidoylglutamate deiminase [SAR324 cluster bacterium]MCH2266161.1 formimidoylglutamate deiminase [SAR324 cluster bacterium]
MNLFAELALTPEGWSKNVRVTLDQFGRITTVESEVEPNPDDQYLRNRILLPALSNLHSHSFQRAMSGLTEKRLEKRDSFWSWRELMYSFLERLNPEQIEAIAALVFMEMLECGYASVGEFHYVHHQRGGQHYENIAETSCRIISAAQKAGIGLTHLPVYYMQGGLNGKKLAEGQLRFGNEHEHFLAILTEAQVALQDAPEDYALGMAPHSLRAVSPDALQEIVEAVSTGPVHIHIAEQLKEVEDIQANYNARPVEWLLQNVAVDSRWCLIHATHMTPEETQNLAKSGAVVGLCPITEANLGDGIFDGTELLLSGGKYGIGSDSNVFIALTEELRLLEYSQRLVRKERNVMTNKTGSIGRALYNDALAGGAQALGRKSGSITPGNWADLLTLDADALTLWGCADDEFLDRWIFTGDDSLVREVWSAGRQMVSDGQHIQHHEIEQRYRTVIQEIRREK